MGIMRMLSKASFELAIRTTYLALDGILPCDGEVGNEVRLHPHDKDEKAQYVLMIIGSSGVYSA